MKARAIHNDSAWPVEIDLPPPEFVVTAGKFFTHCGVIMPDCVHVYRLVPFDRRGRSVEESMEIVEGSRLRGCSPSGLVVRLK